jgi:hypothetical protein
METKELQKVLGDAQKAVDGISDKDMKLKAFEVILEFLLKSKRLTVLEGTPTSAQRRTPTVKSTSSLSTTDRLLLLRDEGFFVTPRTLAEVKEELQRHAWHYPITSLSGPIASLVSKREMRRVREREGKKSIWKYTNP